MMTSIHPACVDLLLCWCPARSGLSICTFPVASIANLLHDLPTSPRLTRTRFNGPLPPLPSDCHTSEAILMASFSEFLSTFDGDLNRRGRQFERFVKWFLKNDPEWATQVQDVWLWDDYPGRWGPDCGIDLVFKSKIGKTWAVQAKCYSANYRRLISFHGRVKGARVFSEGRHKEARGSCQRGFRKCPG